MSRVREEESVNDIKSDSQAQKIKMKPTKKKVKMLNKMLKDKPVRTICEAYFNN